MTGALSQDDKRFIFSRAGRDRYYRRANVAPQVLARVKQKTRSHHLDAKKARTENTGQKPTCVTCAEATRPRPLFQAKGGFRATQETTKLRLCDVVVFPGKS